MSAGLDAWLARIEQLHPSEIELGLERVRRVADVLGVDRLPMPVITVAGTNGKGSVVALTRALAEAAGRRVCVYTSPHLQRFNERISLPEGPADDAALCAAFERVDAARGAIDLTYFEFTTLAALSLFRDSGADLTLLEVGLGGRLDAVNLIDADVAVVTSVGLDHTDWLGDSREKVAVEKLGIGRAGRPLVYGEVDAPSNLDAELSRLGVTPLRAGQAFRVEDAALVIRDRERDRRYPLPLSPRLGADNLASACQALAAAGLAPANDAPHRVADTGLTGRCQVRRFRGVQCVLDVGHNLEALTRLRQRLPTQAGRRRLVLGMMADKPVEAVIALFADHADHWYLASPALARAADIERLARALPADARAARFDSVAAAVQQAVADSDAGDQVLVTGSFHTVAEALNAMDQGD